MRGLLVFVAVMPNAINFGLFIIYPAGGSGCIQSVFSICKKVVISLSLVTVLRGVAEIDA